MSVPGEWQTPAGEYGRFGRVGFAEYGPDGFGSGQVYPGSNDILGASLFARSVAGNPSGTTQPGDGSWGACFAEVPEVPMSTRTPEDFGAFRPASAVGFDWETPAALAVSLRTVVPAPGFQTVDMAARSEVTDTRMPETRPAVQWHVATGMMGSGGLVSSGETITATPGLTSPAQYGVTSTYTVPAGDGSIATTHEAPWSRTIPTGGAHGWTLYVVTLADVRAGTVPTYQLATAEVVALKSQRTAYAPSSRYRWLYDVAPPSGGTYGWGLRLT